MAAAEETVASAGLVDCSIRAAVVLVTPTSLLLISLKQQRSKTTVLVMELPKKENDASLRTKYLLFHPVKVFY